MRLQPKKPQTRQPQVIMIYLFLQKHYIVSTFFLARILYSNLNTTIQVTTDVISIVSLGVILGVTRTPGIGMMGTVMAAVLGQNNALLTKGIATSMMNALEV